MAESDRLDELFKYFRSAQDIAGIDTDSNVEHESKAPRLSHDAVLNALAQLGCLRLGCERAFVSLIDNKNQYLVAEVSKTVSLYDADYHPGDEGLAFGVRALDLVSGICAGSMPAFTDDTCHVLTSNMVANSKNFVINNFTYEPKYQTRPYVQAFPYMRFYAGVPIRTTSGHVIGTYAVIDNQPREGLDEEGYRVISEIASTMMRHLELLKIQTNHNSALNLLGGLKSFVQGSDITPVMVDTGSHVPKQPSQQDRNGRTDTTASEPAKQLFTVDEQLNGNQSHDVDTRAHGSKETLRLNTQIFEPTAPTSSTMPTTLTKDTSSEPSMSPAEQRGERRNSKFNLASCQYRDLLTRASESIQETTHMDEVLFVAAPSPAHSGFDSKNCVNVNESDTTIGSRHALTETREARPVLSRNSDEHTVTQELHTELLSRFPSGCFFNFTGEEARVYAAFASSDSHNIRGNKDGQSQNTVPMMTGQSCPVSLEDVLRRMLPAAKSLLYLPLFTAEIRDCPWSIIAWSADKRRVLQEEDFSYLGLFGVAIQAEFARIKTVVENQAKSDFISSISHELRSPLHGILGNAELLLDGDIGEEERQMAIMIEKCGKSLLSTMDHILTYSKINNSIKVGKLPLHGLSEKDNPPPSIDLSAVIEDSVDTLMAGSLFRSLADNVTSSGRRRSRVMGSDESKEDKHGPLVSLAIDPSSSWYVATEGPVWARCVMNVLGNALKYTESGIIEVKMQLGSVAGNETTRTAVLSVSDTGCGISAAYLRDHLYQPFLQENASSNGLGLGLSIVKKLIAELGGSINVQSTVGRGTVVEISVPLSMEPSQGESILLQRPGRKICFIGKSHGQRSTDEVDLRSLSSSGVVSSALSLYCEKWFDIKVNYSEHLEDAAADVVVIFEEDFHSLSELDKNRNGKRYPRCAYLVIPAASATKRNLNATKADRLFYLMSPFGPRRLATLLEQAFDYADKIKNDATVPEESEVTEPPAERPEESEAAAAAPDTAELVVSSSKASEQEQEQQPDAQTQGQPHVLLVDDNDVNLKLLAQCLERWGIAYRTACDGAEAVEVYQSSSNPFAYILMDISMPVMNGIEATRVIRNLEASESWRQRSRIIALTGLGDERTRQEALMSGMDAFLTKPVRLREVKTLLKRSATK